MTATEAKKLSENVNLWWILDSIDKDISKAATFGHLEVTIKAPYEKSLLEEIKQKLVSRGFTIWNKCNQNGIIDSFSVDWGYAASRVRSESENDSK